MTDDTGKGKEVAFRRAAGEEMPESRAEETLHEHERTQEGE
jgi:hypothetical protein